MEAIAIMTVVALAACATTDSAAPQPDPFSGGPLQEHRADKPGAATGQLTRWEVLSSMKAVQPRVRDCYVQYGVPGIVTASITIAPSGTVSKASAGRAFQGTPTGTCVEEALLRDARFRPFPGPPMSIQYPFQLRGDR